jgi:hypothetical protein
MSTSVFVELKANISEFQAKMGEARSEMGKLEKKGESTSSQIGSFGKTAMMGVAGAAIGIGALSVETADKQEMAQKQLENSLKAAGQSWENSKNQVKAAGDEAVKFGYTQEQVDQALNTGVISTQNLGKAHDNLKVAIELAAAKHIDLNTAMQTVDKAANGQTVALKKLGIDLPIAAGGAKKVASANDALHKAQQNVNDILAKTPDAANAGSKAHAAYEKAVGKVEDAHKKLSAAQDAGNQVLDALKHRLSGQADAAAGTFAGKMAAAKAEGQNLMATLGQKLLPVLTKLMDELMKGVHWLEKHKGAAQALGIVIGTIVVGAIVLYTASMISAAIATVSATWPILLIIAAIALLVVGVIEVVKHWKQIAAFFASVWAEVKNLFHQGVQFVLDVFHMGLDWIKTHWQLLVAILTGPIGLAVLFIKEHWNTIKNDVAGLIGAIVSFFTGLPAKIVNGLGDIVGTIWGTLKNTVSWLDTHVWQPVSSWFAGLPGKIANAIGSGLSAVGSVGKSIINGIIDGLNAAIGAVNSNIPSVFGHKIFPSIPNIPHLALGGSLNAGQMALVGENGPELFVAGASGGRIVPNNALGGGGAPANIHLQIDGKTFAQLVLPSLQTTVLEAQRGMSVPIFGTV